MKGNNKMNLKDILSKGKKVEDGKYKDVKLGLLKELQRVMGGSMADELRGMKKVTVASPDKEGLEAGLEKAKEMVDGEESEDSEKMVESEEIEDESEEEPVVAAEPTDVKKEIEMLEMKIAELKSKLG